MHTCWYMLNRYDAVCMCMLNSCSCLGCIIVVALLHVYRALLHVYRALLHVYRALLHVYRAHNRCCVRACVPACVRDCSLAVAGYASEGVIHMSHLYRAPGATVEAVASGPRINGIDLRSPG